MLKKFAKRIRLNFRNTRSERVANMSYSHYHQQMKKIVKAFPFFVKKKLNK